MAHGHSDAWLYPLGLLFEEAEIVAERVNAQICTEVSLNQMGISAIPNMSVSPAATKKIAENFAKAMKQLME